MHLMAPVDRFIHGKVKKLLPKISDTEMEALDSGTDDTGWVAEIIKGKPDWSMLDKLDLPELTEAEKAFVEGPVEELCKMLDAEEIDAAKELPEHVMQFLKDNKFFGMCIPKEYGGLGFSTLGHSAAVIKIASRNAAAAVTAMVPNSLGPGELLTHYGTDEQRQELLPKLANGDLIPCFGLTELTAGSDASSMKATGTVFRDDAGDVKIKMNFNKRYITLAPMADLVGLAFKLHDPEGLLPEGLVKEGGDNITIALIKSLDENGQPIEGLDIGDRHDPSGIAFLNGTVNGTDVVISTDDIIGGVNGVSKGWSWLMESLGVGRSVSLPSMSEGSSKLSNFLASSRPRMQFNQEINSFEAIEGLQAKMVGLTYLMHATRLVTMAMIDQNHEKPTVPSAFGKYFSTEDNRRVVNNMSDILAGKMISHGPNNVAGEIYNAVPISITVEGANEMTAAMIMGGQGIVRPHPYILDEVMAGNDKNKARGGRKLRSLLMKHGANAMCNGLKGAFYGVTGGYGTAVPKSADKSMKGYYRQINRLCASFNVAAEATLATLGGAFKKKERIAKRLGFIEGNLYRASAALWLFDKLGSPDYLKPVVEWSVQHALHEVENNFDGLIANLSKRPHLMLGGLSPSAAVWLTTFPLFGKHHNPEPSDALEHKIAKAIVAPGELRDYMFSDIFIPDNDHEPVGRLALAHKMTHEAAAVHKKLRKAKIKKAFVGNVIQEHVIEDAVMRQVITAEEGVLALEAAQLAIDVNEVDIYSRDMSEHKGPVFRPA